MVENESIFFRPHHIARFAHFFTTLSTMREYLRSHSNYDKKTAENIYALFEQLVLDPNASVIAVPGYDAVCGVCSNYQGKCRISSEEDLQRADRAAAIDYNLLIGETYSVKKIGSFGDPPKVD